jgi:uncharacterized protein YprB with RNaseH-like and TPR domain
MRSFRDKLDALAVTKGAGAGAPPKPASAAAPVASDSVGDAKANTLAALRNAIRDLETRKPIRREGAHVHLDGTESAPPLPGSFRETPHGALHLIERIYEPAHAHGRVPVADVLAVRADTLADIALDESLRGVDVSRLLLLDLETTGLAGGTGTLPFLIGLGWFEDQSLRLEQLFLRRPGEEGPMLAFLRERMERAELLVTFNGKSFDWPLVRTRFVMNRVPLPKVPPHLDVLHAARRVWKRRLGETRLMGLEREILGFEREGDVPGSEIPAEYLAYLRTGSPGRLAGVVEHNQHDLVAMTAIVAKLAGLYESGAVAGGNVSSDHAHDLFGLAKVSVRAADEGRATRFLDACAEAADVGGSDDALQVEAHVLRARLARRAKDFDQELVSLERALKAAGSDDVLCAHVHVLLSKHHEHRSKNFARALDHARAAAQQAEDESLAPRISRLERRLHAGATTL